MIIYKITNVINNKIYIGQTIGSLNNRWNDHCSAGKNKSAVRNAIKKYGKESFKIEIIYTASSREELNIKEIYYIQQFNSVFPNGYNLQLGGGSRNPSDETRRRMSLASKGRIPSNLDKLHTEETRLKAAETRKSNKYKHSEETKRKISNFNRRPRPEFYKPVLCIELSKEFDSISHASKELNLHISGISRACRGVGIRCGGYTFKYIEVI